MPCWIRILTNCHSVPPQNTLLQVMVSRNLLSFMDDETLENRLAAAAATGGKRKSWDDEFVLKRQFSALIPAFDPRPGRTNVNQTSDLDIPAPGSLADVAFNASGLCGAMGGGEVAGGTCGQLPVQPALALTLRGPHWGSVGGATGAVAATAAGSTGGCGAPAAGTLASVVAGLASTAAATGALSSAAAGTSTSMMPMLCASAGDVEIQLHNPEWTIFRAVQELMQASSMNKTDKMRKVG